MMVVNEPSPTGPFRFCAATEPVNFAAHRLILTFFLFIVVGCTGTKHSKNDGSDEHLRSSQANPRRSDPDWTSRQTSLNCSVCSYGRLLTLRLVYTGHHAMIHLVKTNSTHANDDDQLGSNNEGFSETTVEGDPSGAQPVTIIVYTSTTEPQFFSNIHPNDEMRVSLPNGNVTDNDTHGDDNNAAADRDDSGGSTEHEMKIYILSEAVTKAMNVPAWSQGETLSTIRLRWDCAAGQHMLVGDSYGSIAVAGFSSQQPLTSNKFPSASPLRDGEVHTTTTADFQLCSYLTAPPDQCTGCGEQLKTLALRYTMEGLISHRQSPGRVVTRRFEKHALSAFPSSITVVIVTNQAKRPNIIATAQFSTSCLEPLQSGDSFGDVQIAAVLNVGMRNGVSACTRPGFKQSNMPNRNQNNNFPGPLNSWLDNELDTEIKHCTNTRWVGETIPLTKHGYKSSHTMENVYTISNRVLGCMNLHNAIVVGNKSNCEARGFGKTSKCDAYNIDVGCHLATLTNVS
eukprot:m.39776 g.39776  ORF g.39776 m.39776 type:complete len:513 (-) comp18284_c0_seq2:122-1660(-)